MNNVLVTQFDTAMLEIYQRAKSELGYNASLFLRMLYDRKGVATAKALINAAQVSDGYSYLHEKGRLDLTVEALIVDNPKWWPLFTNDEIAKAKSRLAQYEYFTGHP